MTEPIVETILHGQNVMLPDSKVDGVKVDRTKSAQNPDWTEPAANTILSLKFVMWRDSRVDRFQVDKHPGGQTP